MEGVLVGGIVTVVGDSKFPRQLVAAKGELMLIVAVRYDLVLFCESRTTVSSMKGVARHAFLSLYKCATIATPTNAFPPERISPTISETIVAHQTQRAM